MINVFKELIDEINNLGKELEVNCKMETLKLY